MARTKTGVTWRQDVFNQELRIMKDLLQADPKLEMAMVERVAKQQVREALTMETNAILESMCIRPDRAWIDDLQLGIWAPDFAGPYNEDEEEAEYPSDVTEEEA